LEKVEVQVEPLSHNFVAEILIIFHLYFETQIIIFF